MTKKDTMNIAEKREFSEVQHRRTLAATCACGHTYRTHVLSRGVVSTLERVLLGIQEIAAQQEQPLRLLLKVANGEVLSAELTPDARCEISSHARDLLAALGKAGPEPEFLERESGL